MKQIEITVRLKENTESAIDKLEKQQFKKIRESDIDDIYLTNWNEKMTIDNIQVFLKHSVLLRTLDLGDKIIKKITYKDKEFNAKGDVISEQKVNLNCDNLTDAEKLFNCLGFNKLVEVKYHVIVYEKDGVELAFQIVENLGTLIEYENENDFTGKKLEEINLEKQKMVDEIKEYNIEITDEIDVKKAWELIRKTYDIKRIDKQ